MRRFLVLLVLTMLLPVELKAQSGPLDWPEITREARPWTRWWWLGSAVDAPNLTSELEDLARAGFGGVEVTSIYGVKGAEDRYLSYLSPEWIAALGHAAREANRLGMGLDMPPGSGWKMGGPEVPIEQASRSLRIRVDTVAGGTVWRPQLPEGSRLDGLAAYSATGQQVDIAAGRAPGAVTEWTAPPGTWRVFQAEIRQNGEQVKRPAPGGTGPAVDVLSSVATRSYLDYFAGRMASVPDGVVRGYFHDSYEYSGDVSTELFETFRQARGYDLATQLPALSGEGDPETIARVRSDYRQTMDEMLLNNLVRQFTAFAHAGGSISRNQAHGSPGNILDLYAASDIPETEIFGPLDGPDADPLISKFASSAAHVAGKPRASAESMTWLAEHFTETLDNVKQAVDGLFVSGINHVFFHGTAYSPDEAEWPGWLFYASTEFNDRNAFWRDIPALNAYIARVQSVMQSGVPDNDILLYWPVFDNWHDPRGRTARMDFRVHDPNWFHDLPLGQVATRLWEGGYGFDYVSDRLLENAIQVKDGALEATGGARYQVVLVPGAEHVPVATLTRLLDLAEGGATVLFVGGLPTDVPGLHEVEARRQELARVRERVQLPARTEGGVRIARLGAGRVMVAEQGSVAFEEVPAPAETLLLNAAGVRPEEIVRSVEGIQAIRRRWEGGHHYFVTNARGDQRVAGWYPLAVSAASVALLDPMSGRAGMARTRQGADGVVEVYLHIEPGQSVLLRTFDSAVEGQSWRYLETTDESFAIGGRWQVEFIAGGPTLPGAFSTESLTSWTDRGADAESFAGTAKYATTFDAPAAGGDYLLDLGRVAESARVRLNGVDLGVVFARPFTVPVPTGALRSTGNVLEVDVTNLSANRIRDLDRRGVEWRIFHDINFVNIDYRPFDASGWDVRESGLLGPVRLVRIGG